MPRKKRKKVTGRDFYRADVEVPSQDGKRKRRAVYAKTVNELERKVAKIKREVETGMLIEPSKLTVSQFIEEWLDTSVRNKVSAGTFESYKSVVRTHIDKRIGKVSLSKISPVHIQKILSEMEKKGSSPSKRKHAYTVLNRVGKHALKFGLIQRNPCDLIDVPRVDLNRPEMKYFDQEQSLAFLEEAKSERFYALYFLAVTRGIRQGELFGLQKKDIDLKNGTLSIRRTATEIHGKIVVNKPKTKSSRRQIELSELACDAILDRLKAKMKEGTNGSDFVFCDQIGGVMRRQNFQRRCFKPLLKQAKLPDIRFHDLRHTAATLMLKQEINPKIVSEILGHSNVGITLDMYSHVTPTMHREAAKKIDSLFA